MSAIREEYIPVPERASELIGVIYLGDKQVMVQDNQGLDLFWHLVNAEVVKCQEMLSPVQCIVSKI